MAIELARTEEQENISMKHSLLLSPFNLTVLVRVHCIRVGRYDGYSSLFCIKYLSNYETTVGNQVPCFCCTVRRGSTRLELFFGFPLAKVVAVVVPGTIFIPP